MVVDSGAAENVIGIRQTERSKSGKGFKGPGGENIKNYGEQVRTLRDLGARAHGRSQT